jgi:hypothetical protein
VAFNENPFPVSAHRHGGREEERLAGDDFFRLSHVGENFLRRLPCAAAHAGECQRGAHDLEKLTATDGIQPLRRLFGELRMQKGLKIVGAGELFQAAPILLAAPARQTLADRR